MIKVNFSESKQPAVRRAKPTFVFFVMLALIAMPLTQANAEISADPPYPAPTLISPDTGGKVTTTKPLIKGLSINNSVVKIFIDGVLNGQFQVENHASGTANFAYEPFLNLKPGWHTVKAIAENQDSKASRYSNQLEFIVEYPMPAPTMFRPVVNNLTTEVRPWFIGLAKNDSLVKIYIDGVLNGQFQVENHASGTANFAYKTLHDITSGKHSVYAIAVSRDNKESRTSEVIEFTISETPDESEVKGEETGDKTASKETETINGNDSEADGDQSTESTETNEDDDGSEVNTTDSEEAGEAEETGDEEQSNWPLIVGLMVLFVVLIIFIDNLVRKSRTGKMDSGSGKDTHQTSEDKSKPDKPTPDELFPPPPPDIK